MGSCGISAPQRDFGQEWPQIKSFEQDQFAQLEKFVSSQPLFAQALQYLTGQASSAWNQAQGYLGTASSFLPGAAADVQQAAVPLGEAGTLGGELFSSLQQFVEPVLASGGALTPEQERDVSQATRGIIGAQGRSLHTNAALGE